MQQVKLLVCQFEFQFFWQLPANMLGRQRRMTKAIGPLIASWEMRLEFQTPGCVWLDPPSLGYWETEVRVRN